MATTDFEVKQLLKAYRKGLISDELFEAQILEMTKGGQNGPAQYTYNGKSVGSEREMIMQLLDEFRCRENFAAEFFGRWIDVSDQECHAAGYVSYSNGKPTMPRCWKPACGSWAAFRSARSLLDAGSETWPCMLRRRKQTPKSYSP